MVRIHIIDLNHIKLKYYSFTQCYSFMTEVVMSYHKKYVSWKKQKYINVKVFNKITNKNEAKTYFLWLKMQIQ